MSKNEYLGKWLETDRTAKIEWALSYLNKKGLLRYRVSFSATPEETLNQVIRNYSLSGERGELIKKMKRAWVQRRFRNGQTGKRSYNFILPKTAQSQLKALAQFEGRTSTKVLEDLITDSYEQLVAYRAEHPMLFADKGYKLRKPYRRLLCFDQQCHSTKLRK